MKDPRRVDELTIAELEEALRIRRQEAREQRLRQFRDSGRAIRAEVAGDHYQPTARRRAWRKRLVNAFLLLVEVAAVFGLLFLGWSFYQNWRTLNREAVNLQAQPSADNPGAPAGAQTLVPTPMIGAIVLPGGHTSPNDPGGAQFNLAEIPEQMRPLVASNPVMQLPTPTPAPQHAVRVVISSIGVDAPIVQGIDWDALRLGVGQLVGSANPGDPGNLVLSAHNDIFGEIFRDLDQLQPGDVITVYTQKSAFNYQVTGTQVVEPTAVHVMDPTQSATITLISCYPYLVDTQRIVVFAELLEG